jgi:hypothetical protein
MRVPARRTTRVRRTVLSAVVPHFIVRLCRRAGLGEPLSPSSLPAVVKAGGVSLLVPIGAAEDFSRRFLSGQSPLAPEQLAVPDPLSEALRAVPYGVLGPSDSQVGAADCLRTDGGAGCIPHLLCSQRTLALTAVFHAVFYSTISAADRFQLDENVSACAAPRRVHSPTRRLSRGAQLLSTSWVDSDVADLVDMMIQQRCPAPAGGSAADAVAPLSLSPEETDVEHARGASQLRAASAALRSLVGSLPDLGAALRELLDGLAPVRARCAARGQRTRAVCDARARRSRPTAWQFCPTLPRSGPWRAGCKRALGARPSRVRASATGASVMPAAWLCAAGG